LDNQAVDSNDSHHKPQFANAKYFLQRHKRLWSLDSMWVIAALLWLRTEVWGSADD